jgi:NAD(P)-dependent dehydrogenase (short-subunit alcohol dehydrogenase family)
MRIAIVGASGTIGRAVVVAALARKYDVLPISRSRSEIQADITRPESLRTLYQRLGRVDAVVSVAGEGKFGALARLTDEDFQHSLSSKLMGQINLVRLGLEHVQDGGSFTLTTGILGVKPSFGSAALSTVNGGLEAFVRAAALELPRGVRINCVRAGWVAETLTALGRDPQEGTPAERVAEVYLQAVEGTLTGQTLTIGG